MRSQVEWIAAWKRINNPLLTWPNRITARHRRRPALFGRCSSAGLV
jgi:hypothetical protein